MIIIIRPKLNEMAQRFSQHCTDACTKKKIQSRLKKSVGDETNLHT